MPRLLKLATLLAKVEDPEAEGEDSLPLAANGLYAMVAPPAPAADFQRVAPYTGGGSLLPGSMGARRWEKHVEVPLRGAGAAYSLSVIPKADALLRMGGFAADLDDTENAESWTYAPISSGFESFSVYLYLDGVLTKLLGCRALPSFVFPLGGPARVVGELRSLWTDPADAATVVPTGEPTTQYPVMLSSLLQLTPSGGDPYAPKHGEIKLDLGRQITPRKDASAATGYAGMVMLAGRAPVLTLEAEATLEDDFAWWDALAAGTQIACSFQVGATKYNQLKVNIPVMQFEKLEQFDAEGILMYRASCLLVSPTGVDDDLTIVFD
jgi:hypothetical protein